jgi:hypothetical protein
MFVSWCFGLALLSIRIFWASMATTCAQLPPHQVLVCTACAVSSQRSPL